MERDIHTYRQSDMVYIFLRMRLLASPFGLAIMFLHIRYLDSEIDESAAKELADAKEYARRMDIIAVPKEDDKIEELIEERAPYNRKFVLCEALLGGLVSSKKLPQDPDSLHFDVCRLFDVVIWPSLALMESNSSVAEEICNVLKKLPYEDRYRLYDLRKNDTFQSHSWLIRRKVDCGKRIKYIIERVIKDNAKPTDRELDKLSHSCPGFLFDYILSQIQIYDNLMALLWIHSSTSQTFRMMFLFIAFWKHFRTQTWSAPTLMELPSLCG
jgi:hypothetical protein